MCVKSEERSVYTPKTKKTVARPAGWFLCGKGTQIPCILPKQNIVAGRLVGSCRVERDTVSLSTPKPKHCGEKHCGETAWLYNFLVYSQDKTLWRETLRRDRLFVQCPCLLPRQNIAARNIAARPPGCTISLSTPKTKHCGEKHCRETAWLYNFLVYSQDKTLWRETLWRDRRVVQFPCLLPRQNIAARNIVARPPGCTISLYTPKTKHCGETGWLVLVV